MSHWAGCTETEVCADERGTYCVCCGTRLSLLISCKPPPPPEWPYTLVEGDRRHGSVAGYAQGCRCQSCRAATAAYKREWLKRRAS